MMRAFRNVSAFIFSALAAGGAYFLQMFALGTVKGSEEISLLELLGMLVIGYLPVSLVALIVLGIPILYALKKIDKDSLLTLVLSGFIGGCVVSLVIGLNDIITVVMYGVNGLAAAMVFSLIRANDQRHS